MTELEMVRFIYGVGKELSKQFKASDSVRLLHANDVVVIEMSGMVTAVPISNVVEMIPAGQGAPPPHSSGGVSANLSKAAEVAYNPEDTRDQQADAAAELITGSAYKDAPAKRGPGRPRKVQP